MSPSSVIAVGMFLGALGAPAASVQDEGPLAPDGKPGLGTERDAHELGRLLVAPDEEEEVFLRELRDLPSAILIEREVARRGYRRLGYFDLLPRTADQELAALHARYRELEAQAATLIASPDRVSRAFGRMLVDPRFRMRLELLESFELETGELRRGMTLLAASQDGLFDLRDTEARNVASRIDLSAALLRAIQLDLDVLRERGDEDAPGSPDPAWTAEWDGISELPSQAERLSAIDALKAEVRARQERLESSLFTSRLEGQVRTLVDKREGFAAQAREHLERAKRFLLVPPYDEDPPAQITSLSTSDRHRYALSETLRGVSADPLNDGLAYWTGVCTERLDSPRESRSWFDRFLALRGIRPQDADTTRRDLTDEEKNALEKVMQAYTGPGGRGLGGPLGR